MPTFRHLLHDARSHRILRQDTGDIRFGDILLCGDDAYAQTPHIALLGVPQHQGVERNGGRIGAAAAPDVIRGWLQKMTISNGVESLPTHLRIADYGNIICDDKSLEEIHDAQQQIVQELLQQGVFVIVWGGGHDIAYPNGCALGAVSSSLGIINFDAHPDVRPPVAAGRHSGSPFRQLIESPAVNLPAGCFVEFGIQSFAAAEAHLRYVLEQGHQLTMMHHIHHQGFETSLEAAWSHASQAEKVYISFDIDGVASAFAPGVSAPSADGFTPRQLFDAALFLAAEPQTALVDIVEVNPLYDADGRTAKLAAMLSAHLIWARGKCMLHNEE